MRLAAIAIIEGALAALEAERAVINDLNVYPVPDGDTGTNLALTVRAVLDELNHSTAASIPVVAAAVTKGSLMGARGNSGVILSQIVRGVCDVWGHSQTLTTADVKRALREATNCAYRAVREPVEGTMLTVIREMAEGAESVPDVVSLDGLLGAVEAAGRVSVEGTTALLPVLQKADVVDAGGYGLLVIFQGLAGGLSRLHDGTYTPASAEIVLHPASAGAPLDMAHPGHSELSQFRYCTSLLISGPALDRAAIEAFLPTVGDSDLVVGDARMLKIHVHTNDPGVVLSEAVRHGVISEIEINDMHAQTAARDERLMRKEQERGGTAVVVVAAGEGNKELFRQLGRVAIVDGGQSMNPSAAEILAAVDGLGAEEVVILPNNGNIILTAEQAAGMSGRHVAVVPTTSLPAGLAAMVAFDAEQNAQANASAMTEAIQGLRSAEVTLACRDSEVDGVSVRSGQAMGLVDGHLVTVGEDLAHAVEGVFAAFAGGGAEYVTVLTALNGSTLTREGLQAIAERVMPEVEVSYHEGGQPLYPILASAE